MKNKSKIFKMVLSALFLALCYVLPFITGQIPEIGAMLCPMHIPVIICGFICGWPWGLLVGFLAPLFRSLTLGMPPLFPTAICMALELAAYGLVSGITRKILPKKKPYIYCSLLISMIIGRVVWGIAMFILMAINGDTFGFSAFLAGAVTNAIPGIILQIVLIPPIVMILENTKIIKNRFK
ncbi:MAG: ECF transporter S component [Clostridia bacterium]|nr:ECF transporter S component [Clostridia bacterium]